jgi:hypothetical protein
VKKLLKASLLAWAGLIVFTAIADAGPQMDWQQTLVEARKEGRVVGSPESTWNSFRAEVQRM